MASGATFTFTVTGVDEIRRKMQAIRRDLQYTMLVNILKRALRKPMAIAKNNAPIGTDYWTPQHTHPGRLKSSFRIRKMRQTKARNGAGIIEVQLQNTAYYALWVEYGHRIVFRRGGKKVFTGRRTRPVPFMRKTFEETKGIIQHEVETEFRKALARRGLL